MKKLYAFILFGAAIFAVAACNNELQIEDNTKINGPVYETLSVKVGAETKASLATNASKTAFENGDKIAVWTDAGVFQECVVSNGEITVDIFGGPRSNYAVFYNSATVPTFESSTLKITLPAEYNYADVAGDKNPVPMVAKNVSGDAADMTFYAVCALARIAVPGIPATADKLLVTFDKDVTGEFTVTNPGTDSPSISAASASTKNVVTINLVAGTDYSGAVINIPVPVGTVTASVQAMAGDNVLETKATVINAWSAARAKGKKVTAAFTPSMYSMVLAPGNLYTESGTLKMASNYYEHTYVFCSEAKYDKEDTYDASNRTHFDFSETYYLMRGMSLDSKDKAYDASVDTYNSLTNNDIEGGGGKTWRVPSNANWVSFTTGTRPGAKVRNGVSGEYTSGWKFIKVLVSSGMVTSGTTVWDGSAISALSPTALEPSTDYQVGLLLFPDNVEITGSFGKLGNKNTGESFINTTITKTNLDALVNAGCAFLPGVGRWFYDQNEVNGIYGAYLSSSRYSVDRVYVLVFSESNGVMPSGNSRAKDTKDFVQFGSVRLVRDLN